MILIATKNVSVRFHNRRTPNQLETAKPDLPETKRTRYEAEHPLAPAAKLPHGFHPTATLGRPLVGRVQPGIEDFEHNSVREPKGVGAQVYQTPGETDTGEPFTKTGPVRNEPARYQATGVFSPSPAAYQTPEETQAGNSFFAMGPNQIRWVPDWVASDWGYQEHRRAGTIEELDYTPDDTPEQAWLGAEIKEREKYEASLTAKMEEMHAPGDIEKRKAELESTLGESRKITEKMKADKDAMVPRAVIDGDNEAIAESKQRIVEIEKKLKDLDPGKTLGEKEAAAKTKTALESDLTKAHVALDTETAKEKADQKVESVEPMSSGAAYQESYRRALATEASETDAAAANEQAPADNGVEIKEVTYTDAVVTPDGQSTEEQTKVLRGKDYPPINPAIRKGRV